MSDEVKPELIKKTQDLLGKYFKKPPLTEKLLKKPPFRFLHDIITAIIKETGFLDGLFTEDEMNSANIKDKDAKLAYLTKLIDVLKIITGTSISARPSKIISGQEPMKTNELLQVIGKCIDKKVSSTEAIEQYKKNVDKKSSRKQKSQTSTDKDSKKSNLSSRQPSQTRKSEKSSDRSKANSTSERKKRTSGGTDGIAIDSKPKTLDKEKSIEEKQEVELDAKPEVQNSNLVTRASEGIDLVQETTTKKDNVEVVDEKLSSEEPKRTAISTPGKETSSDEVKKESKTRKSSAIDSAKKRASTGKDREKRTGATVVENEGSMQVPKQRSLEESSNVTREETSAVVDKSKESNSIEQESRPKTASLRPPSVRPSSARPAAPRIRAKNFVMTNEEIPTPMGTINVIIEGDNAKEDDAEEMIIVESSTGNANSLENIGVESQLTQEHGHLVAQILETQKELVHGEDVDVMPKKVEIAWETGTRRDRETMAKEVDKLRGTIQTLTRATNPLGKLMDYLQEDMEIMRRELQEYRSEFHEINEELERERMQMQDSLKPMKDALQELGDNVTDQLQRICQVKSRILKNDQKIHQLLNGHL